MPAFLCIATIICNWTGFYVWTIFITKCAIMREYISNSSVEVEHSPKSLKHVESIGFIWHEGTTAAVMTPGSLGNSSTRG